MKITGPVALAGAMTLIVPAAVQAEDAIDIGGKIKVRAYSESPSGGDATQRLYLKNFDLSVEAEIDEGISAGGTLKRDGDEGDIEVDDAFVTAALAGDASITAGLLYLPFGVFETSMISDPLTLDLGEKLDPAVVVEGSTDDLSGAVYVYQRDLGEDDGRTDRIGGYGTSVGYAVEGADSGFSVTVGYISDVWELSEAPGFSASAGGSLGDATVLVEHVGALEELTDGMQPSAVMFELGYSLENILGSEAVVAVGYQSTREASGIELPESRMIVGLSAGITDNTSVAFEWRRDEDYGGDSTDLATAQFTVEF